MTDTFTRELAAMARTRNAMPDTFERMSDAVCMDTPPKAPSALTYAERLLAGGNVFEFGMLAGLDPDEPATTARDARKAYAEYRKARGYASHAEMLTRPEAQPKLGKGERYALGLMLTPARSLDYVGAGLTRPVNACPRASAGCERACLATSGHGAFSATQRARQVRHGFLLSSPFYAGVLIGREITRALEKYGPDNVTLRLNVLTDYRWEFVAPMALRRLQTLGVRVYDYTAWAPSDREPVHGYSLTYSAKEDAHYGTTGDAGAEYLEGLLMDGHNVAIPFTTRKGQDLPAWHTFDMPRDRYSILFRVVDGDLTDDRTDDPREPVGVIIGLRAKGNAGKSDASGFIRTPSH